MGEKSSPAPLPTHRSKQMSNSTDLMGSITNALSTFPSVAVMLLDGPKENYNELPSNRHPPHHRVCRRSPTRHRLFHPGSRPAHGEANRPHGWQDSDLPLVLCQQERRAGFGDDHLPLRPETRASRVWPDRSDGLFGAQRIPAVLERSVRSAQDSARRHSG